MVLNLASIMRSEYLLIVKNQPGNIAGLVKSFLNIDNQR